MSSYSSTYPSIRPVFNADFSNAGRLDSRISYSRSTTGTYFGKNKHLSSENLLTHSNDVSSAYSKNGLTETGGQAAPDGGTDAYKLTEDSATGFHRIYYAAPVLSSGSLTVSCYVKYIGRQWVYIRLRDSGAAYRHVWFDVQNGTKGTEETNMTGSITASGGGYYKLTATASSVYATSADVLIGGANADGNTQYTGSGADAFAVWGIQASTTGETVLNETSGQIHREYAPTLQTAAINAPRFEYSASDSASMGLLIEGQSTNLATRSDEFDLWSYARVNRTANAAVAPSGSLTADLVYADGTASNTHLIQSSFTATAAAYTFSVYAKAAGCNYVRLSFENIGSGYGHFDLANGTVTASNTTSQIESVGNGWWRVSITETLSSGTSYGRISISTSSGTVYWDGDDYSGVLLSAAQIEQNSFPSSPIATSGSTVTRASDSASMDLNQAGFSGGPFTVVSETEGGQGVYPRAWALTDGTASERVYVFRNSATSGSSTDWYVYGSTGGTGYVTSTIPSSASAGKLAVSFNTNDVSFTANGNSAATDPSAPIPSGLDTLKIGTSWSGGSNHLNGHIKRIALFGEALSDSNIQSLTK